jgi:hypothetical protein
MREEVPCSSKPVDAETAIVKAGVDTDLYYSLSRCGVTLGTGRDFHNFRYAFDQCVVNLGHDEHSPVRKRPIMPGGVVEAPEEQEEGDEVGPAKTSGDEKKVRQVEAPMPDVLDFSAYGRIWTPKERADQFMAMQRALAYTNCIVEASIEAYDSQSEESERQSRFLRSEE